MEIYFLLLLWGLPIVLGFVFGQIAEKRHYRSIHAREKAMLYLPTTAGKLSILQGQVLRCELVTGSTVVSVDHFKRAAAALRTFVGGPVKSYESLLDRARREAVLRLKESCPDAHEVVNLRLETVPLAKGTEGGVAAVEVLAFGTAIWVAPAA